MRPGLLRRAIATRHAATISWTGRRVGAVTVMLVLMDGAPDGVLNLQGNASSLP